MRRKKDVQAGVRGMETTFHCGIVRNGREGKGRGVDGFIFFMDMIDTQTCFPYPHLSINISTSLSPSLFHTHTLSLCASKK